MSFPPNEISQLLDLEDGKWPYNLGESTSLNYQVKDLSPLSKEELAVSYFNFVEMMIIYIVFVLG